MSAARPETISLARYQEASLTGWRRFNKQARAATIANVLRDIARLLSRRIARQSWAYRPMKLRSPTPHQGTSSIEIDIADRWATPHARLFWRVIDQALLDFFACPVATGTKRSHGTRAAERMMRIESAEAFLFGENLPLYADVLGVDAEWVQRELRQCAKWIPCISDWTEGPFLVPRK